VKAAAIVLWTTFVVAAIGVVWAGYAAATPMEVPRGGSGQVAWWCRTPCDAGGVP
jgi:hypothetical protein